jgi:hypothetical protein
MDYKFGKAFKGECHIRMDFLTYDNEESEKYKLLCRKRFEMEPNKPKAEGANPQIFRYEFLEPDEFGLIALRITFYEESNFHFIPYILIMHFAGKKDWT